MGQTGRKHERLDDADPEWAWSVYRPDTARPWDLRRAAHLYRRAAFGGTWQELQQAVAAGPEATLDRLLTPPADLAEFQRRYDQFETAVARGESTDALRAWWLRRMLETPYPLLEKMTLFWYGHFAISNAGVKDAALMRQHVAKLRADALGRFDVLLASVTHDPAVLLACNAATGRKAEPNRQFAQRLLETFSLGSGHFSDEDVTQAARALTGWFVLRGERRFIAREYDTGVKQILGQQGKFTSRDLVRIVAQQSAAARLVVGRLYQWLIAETSPPSPALLDPLVESLTTDYDVGRLVQRMLHSNLFFSSAAYRRRVKSPIEFALGIVRGLEGNVSTTQLAADLAELGQDLFYPPTDRGWPAGHHWLDSAAMVGRDNLAWALLGGSPRYEKYLDPVRITDQYGAEATPAAARLLVDLLLQGDVDDQVRQVLVGTVTAEGQRSTALRDVTHAAVALAEFQLA
jgi:uncharacterized protein (DUF1800 family)